jgi:hypothetical protein
MRIIQTTFLLFLTFPLMAANLSADKCQIYIKRLRASPSSHGSATIPVIVKVPFLGGGEFIRKVGFYGQVVSTDLGNEPSCHMSPLPGGMRVMEALDSASELKELGEYILYFPVRSGTVVSECKGYTYSWTGSIFVETDRNTYWLNPELDPSKQFYFDLTTFDLLQSKGGFAGWVATDRDDMRYYNPLGCR